MNIARHFDPSIIGITAEEIAEMDPDEATERACDEINRAADILEAVIAAFGPCFRPAERAKMQNAANKIIVMARGVQARGGHQS